MCASQFISQDLYLSSSGLPSQAFEYIMYNKGLMTEEDYPYTAYVNKYFSIPLNDCELTHLMVFNFYFLFN